jgi:hypothetical protein
MLAKRFSFITLICIILTQNIHSQEFFDELFYSVKGGLVYGNFKGSTLNSTGKPGVMVGIGTEARSYENLFFALSINYYMDRGNVLRIDQQKISKSFAQRVSINSLSIHTFDIGTSFKYYIRHFILDSRVVMPYLFAGPSLSLNLYTGSSYQSIYFSGNHKEVISGFENVTDNFKLIYGILNCGIGMEFYIHSKSYYLDIGYRYGLSPLSSSDSFTSTFGIPGNIYYDSFFLTLGYGF